MSDTPDTPRIVHLHEDGIDLPMYVVVEFIDNKRSYALIAPTEPSANLFLVGDGEDSSLDEVEDDEYDRLKPALDAALARFGLSSQRLGSDVRLSGEIPDALWEEGEYVALEIEDEGDEQDHLIVADFTEGGSHYWLVTPVEPPMIPVELAAGGPRILEEDEIERLGGHFQAALGDVLDDEDED